PTRPPGSVVESDAGLIACYGVFGYGYIVLATFLPAMARDSIDDPSVFGLTWPVFGLAAAASVAMSARWGSGRSRENIWAIAQSAMAIGTALPLISVSLSVLIASAVLVGGTFMVATMAGMQLARERHPDHPTPLVARMTIAFACGQIAGPLLIRAFSDARPMGLSALEWANLIATASLAVSAAWLWRLALRGHRSKSPTA
ncbi:MAG: YbfB/YjiJ family MFS transporter, partial [Betaproteobacteria bacterium]